ncbi:MAG: hypothetical protein RL707_1699 [Pseudomonadota bacterium]
MTTKPKLSASARATQLAKDNERPLVEDIRLLGRILGDVIREQEGRDAYELVEQVRKLSVAFRRDADASADKALKKLLASLTGEATVRVIRAFTYFSHLANLAEDRHHIRRRAVHERAGDTQEGSLTVALSRLKAAGIAPKSIVHMLAQSHVSPVLTAHPTEVQRKSILDAERGIAQLLLKIVTVENIVAQHKSRRVVADKVAADNEGLRQPVRCRLNCVLQIQPPAAAIAQQLREARRILRCRDDQNVAYPRQHQGRKRIVDHRLVVYRQQLL